MKTYKFFLALAMSAMVFACTPKSAEPSVDGDEAKAGVEAAKTLKDYTPSKAEIDTVSYLLGVNFGSFLKGYDFGDVNYAKMIAGIKDFMKAEGDKFLAANKKKAGVEETESGLQYKIIEAGNDVKPAPEDTVFVTYKGTLIDGKVFDETAEGADPVNFTLNNVVAGWREGLQLIGEGGHIELYVPADLAYGEQGRPGIDPNSVLIFDVNLVRVAKFVPATEEVKK